MNLYELNEQTKHASFCFGRMNPPTAGHAQLINTVANSANGGDYFIYVSKTQDAKSNPLDYNTKIKFLQALFPSQASHIVNNPALNTIMAIAQSLYEAGYRRVTFVAGSDRLADFQKLLNSYNGVEGKAHFYDFDTIDYVSSGQREDGAEGIAGISASNARNAAQQGNMQAFSAATGVGKLAPELYQAVRKGMVLEAADGINANLDAIKTNLAGVNAQIDSYVKMMAQAEKLAVSAAAKHPEHAANIQRLYQAFVSKLQRANDPLDVNVGFNTFNQKIKNESL